MRYMGLASCGNEIELRLLCWAKDIHGRDHGMDIVAFQGASGALNIVIVDYNKLWLIVTTSFGELDTLGLETVKWIGRGKWVVSHLSAED